MASCKVSVFAKRLFAFKQHILDGQPELRRRSDDKDEASLVKWLCTLRQDIATNRVHFTKACLSVDILHDAELLMLLKSDDFHSLLRFDSMRPQLCGRVEDFVDHQGRPYAAGHPSIRHYVCCHLSVPDIKPSSCLRHGQHSSTNNDAIRLILSYCLPRANFSFIQSDAMQPDWTPSFQSTEAYSTYFQKSTLMSHTLFDPSIFHAGVASIIPRRLIRSLRGALTKEATIQVFSQFSALDQFHYGKTGRFYKQLIPINLSGHPQPRRITMSIELDQPRQHPDNPAFQVRDLYNYGAAGRPPSDWRCRSMPNDLFHLGEILWKISWHHLSPASRACPPTACQILFYSSSMKSAMRPHKDNGIQSVLGTQTRTSTDKSLNSHLFGILPASLEELNRDKCELHLFSSAPMMRRSTSVT